MFEHQKLKRKGSQNFMTAHLKLSVIAYLICLWSNKPCLKIHDIWCQHQEPVVSLFLQHIIPQNTMPSPRILDWPAPTAELTPPSRALDGTDRRNFDDACASSKPEQQLGYNLKTSCYQKCRMYGNHCKYSSLEAREL